jgi:hypothetical protein
MIAEGGSGAISLFANHQVSLSQKFKEQISS